MQIAIKHKAFDLLLDIKSGVNTSEIADAIDRELILQAMRVARWNRTKAAALLGWQRTTLLAKMKKIPDGDLYNFVTWSEGHRWGEPVKLKGMAA
jgi:DNA-binding NtrC family response regulator